MNNLQHIGKMQSNTTFNICIAKRFSYIACLNNDMFRPLYRPSSRCTLSYYKANYTIYNVFVFVNWSSSRDQRTRTHTHTHHRSLLTAWNNTAVFKKLFQNWFL